MRRSVSQLCPLSWNPPRDSHTSSFLQHTHRAPQSQIQSVVCISAVCVCRTWPGERSGWWCLRPDSRTDAASPHGSNRCNPSPPAGTPYRLRPFWPAPPIASLRWSWPLCQGWRSSDKRPPQEVMTTTSCQNKWRTCLCFYYPLQRRSDLHFIWENHLRYTETTTRQNTSSI